MRTLYLSCLTLVCLISSLTPAAWAADYSVTVANVIHKTINNDNSCAPVSITCWNTNGNGAKLQLPEALSRYAPGTVTFKGMTCTSLDIIATCRYFQTIYTNKGRLSETSHGQWANDTRTASCSANCHNAEIAITEVTAGNTSTQYPVINCK